jgi:hypothetical protein
MQGSIDVIVRDFQHMARPGAGCKPASGHSMPICMPRMADTIV